MDTRFDTVFDDYVERIKKSTKLSRLVVSSPCPLLEPADNSNADGVMASNIYEYVSDESEHLENRIFQKDIFIETYDNKTFFLKLELFGHNENLIDINFQTASLSKSLSLCLQNKVINLRDYIVSMSLETNNFSSFFYKTLKDGLKRFIKFEGASIFHHNYDQDWLALSATTGIRAIKAKDLKRSDIKYYEDSESWVRQSFDENRTIYEHSLESGSLKDNTFGESVERIHNRIYVPINVRPKIIRELEVRYGGDSRDDGKIGVLRLVNIRRNGHYNHPSEIDLYILSHFLEYIAVLGRRYLQLIHADHVLEKATHGFTTDLSTLRLQQQLFSKQAKLFLDYLESVDSAISSHFVSRFREDALIYDRDFTAIQDGMAFQLETVLDLAGGNIGGVNLQKSVCRRPFVEAVKRVHDAAQSIAASYRRTGTKITLGGRQNPADGYIHMPPVAVPSKVLFLVLRNLVENSIKYTDRSKSPVIDISWVQTSDELHVDVRDNGMGIPPPDQNKLFREGFRGRHTLSVSTRGNGLGLFVSKKGLEQFGGKLDLRASSKQGTIFRITVPKLGDSY